MKRLTFSCILRGMAFSALTNMVMPVAEAWAAQETQMVRKVAPNPNAGSGVMPFTTFQDEQLALTQMLPCKWISKDGRLGPSYGNVRYDFLCKGGDFATINLYMDKANAPGDGLGKVRLMYREWGVNANPNAGEAEIAQKFLTHVAGRFIPAALAGEVMDAFWSGKSRSWAQGGVAIKFYVEPVKGQPFKIRNLEVAGTGKPLEPQVVKMIPVAPGDALAADGEGLMKVEVPPPTGDVQIFVYGKDGERPPAPPEEARRLPGIAITKSSGDSAAKATGLTKIVPAPVKVEVPPTVPFSINVLNRPIAPVDPVKVLPASVPTPLPPVQLGVEKGTVLTGTAADKPVEVLTVPQNAPAGQIVIEQGDEGSQQLRPASRAELNTAPAPESKAVPAAPPELSSKLVPMTTDLVGGRQRAPSNFDVYNKAVELTKSVEERAQIAKVEQAKVTAAKQGGGTVTFSYEPTEADKKAAEKKAKDQKIAAQAEARAKEKAAQRAAAEKAISEKAAAKRAAEAKLEAEARAKAAAKVSPTLAVTPTTTLVTPSSLVPAPLKAIPTPQGGLADDEKPAAVKPGTLQIGAPGEKVQQAEQAKPAPVKETPAKPVQPATQPAEQKPAPQPPAAQDVPTQPANYQGPRSQDARPLPQLKFVPKAEPLKAPDEVIQFEDEKSKL